MSRTRLEKPKPITPCSTRNEPYRYRKKTIRRLIMRSEDVVKNYVEELGGGSDWKALAADRDGWKDGCMIGWS